MNERSPLSNTNAPRWVHDCSTLVVVELSVKLILAGFTHLFGFFACPLLPFFARHQGRVFAAPKITYRGDRAERDASAAVGGWIMASCVAARTAFSRDHEPPPCFALGVAP